MNRRVSFRTPASTANLGAGFDALSLALDRYLRVTVETGGSFGGPEGVQIRATGQDHARIPTTGDNLIYRVARHVAAERERVLPPFDMIIENQIPLARGMGSSAAAIVAGITCYEILLDDKLTEQNFFRYAFEFERHPDNLAAALHGGLIAAAVSDNGTALVSKLSVREGIRGIVVIPEFELSTEKARGVLPATYSRADAVYNIQRSALTIAALTSGNWSLLRESMRDRIHQPYRARLIPGLEEILDLEVDGLCGIALSGAGPTVFAFAEPAKADAVGMAIAAAFARHKVAATPHLVQIDQSGRFIESS